MSSQEQCITSCSRIPVIRKNSNHSRSSSSHAAKSVSQVLLLVHLRLFFDVPRPVVLSRQPANPVRLQKRHHVLEFVVDAARCLFFFVTQKCREFQQVFAFDVFEVELGQDSVK